MSSLDDLKRALDAHAPEPSADAGLVGRPAAVARRVTAVRRRRATVGAVAAVAVIGGGSWLAAGLPGQEKTPGPVQEPTSSATEPAAPDNGDEVRFRPETEGLFLGARTVGEPGFDGVDLGTVLTERRLQLAVHCIPPVGAAPAGPDAPWVTIKAAGRTVVQVSCGSGGPPDDDPAAFLYGADLGDGSKAGRNVVFQVRLTDAKGRRYDGPVDGVQLGLGVYSRR